MTSSKRILVAAMLVIILSACTDAGKRKSSRSKRNHMTCRPRSLVRYQMRVYTEWDRDIFPKMFPTYRPPAHWSHLVGGSHSPDYSMWQEGSNASRAVQAFAEKENSELFHRELSQGFNGVLDAFMAPSIDSGVGVTSSVVWADGRHSRISFMMKMVPSPDWFVGLDSAELCFRGRWRKSYSRDLRPLDAGTDQGLTFTSPRWPNVPREPIFAITSSHPDHPAGSFFYPEYKVLPRIARVEFEMISEYRLRKVHRKIHAMPTPTPNTTPKVHQHTANTDNIFEFKEDGRREELTGKLTSVLNQNKASHTRNVQQDDNKPSPILLNSTHHQKDDRRGSPKQEQAKNSNVSSTEPNVRTRSPSVTTTDQNRNPVHTVPSSVYSSLSSSPSSTVLSTGGELPDQIMTKSQTDPRRQNDQSDNSMEELFVSEKLAKDPLEAYRKRVDCQVTEWSDWSACSQTCGYGNKQRSRNVIQMPQYGGSYCPLLKEEALCGSMRNCQWKHFSMMRRRHKSPFKTVGRRRGIRH